MPGATMIESDRPGPVTLRSIRELMSAVFALHPALAGAEVPETGSGSLPAFADNLPQRQWYRGVLHANGLVRHGFLLAPAVAVMAADHLLTGACRKLLKEETA